MVICNHLLEPVGNPNPYKWCTDHSNLYRCSKHGFLHFCRAPYTTCKLEKKCCVYSGKPVMPLKIHPQRKRRIENEKYTSEFSVFKRVYSNKHYFSEAIKNYLSEAKIDSRVIYNDMRTESNITRMYYWFHKTLNGKAGINIKKLRQADNYFRLCCGAILEDKVEDSDGKKKVIQQTTRNITERFFTFWKKATLLVTADRLDPNGWQKPLVQEEPYVRKRKAKFGLM